MGVLVEGRERLSKELVWDFLLGLLYRFRIEYSLFSTSFIIVFRKAFIIAGIPLAMEL